MKRQPKGSRGGGQFAPDTSGKAAPTVAAGQPRALAGSQGFGVEVDYTASNEVMSTFEAFKTARDGADARQWEFQPDTTDSGPTTASEHSARETAARQPFGVEIEFDFPGGERETRERISESADVIMKANAEARANRDRELAARLGATASQNTNPATRGAELAGTVNDIEGERQSRQAASLMDWVNKQQSE